LKYTIAQGIIANESVYRTLIEKLNQIERTAIEKIQKKLLIFFMDFLGMYVKMREN